MDCGDDEARSLLLSAYHIPLQAQLTCVCQTTALATRETEYWIAIRANGTSKRLEENLWKYAGGEAKQFEGMWRGSVPWDFIRWLQYSNFLLPFSEEITFIFRGI
jgi:hypothetical protein